MSATIKMTSVKSSQVEAIGHEGTTLCVKYRSGHVYHYHGVSPQQYEEICKAESVGKYLHANVKGKFKCTKDVLAYGKE